MLRRIIAALALVALIAIAVNSCDDRLSKQLDSVDITFEEAQK